MIKPAADNSNGLWVMDRWVGKADGIMKLAQVFGWEECESSQVFWESNRDASASVKQFTPSHLPWNVNHSSCMYVLRSARKQECIPWLWAVLTQVLLGKHSAQPRSRQVAAARMCPGKIQEGEKRLSRSFVCILAPHWSLRRRKFVSRSISTRCSPEHIRQRFGGMSPLNP